MRQVRGKNCWCATGRLRLNTMKKLVSSDTEVGSRHWWYTLLVLEASGSMFTLSFLRLLASPTMLIQRRIRDGKHMQLELPWFVSKKTLPYKNANSGYHNSVTTTIWWMKLFLCMALVFTYQYIVGIICALSLGVSQDQVHLRRAFSVYLDFP